MASSTGPIGEQQDTEDQSSDSQKAHQSCNWRTLFEDEIQSYMSFHGVSRTVAEEAIKVQHASHRAQRV